jgi:hypothetical protein
MFFPSFRNFGFPDIGNAGMKSLLALAMKKCLLNEYSEILTTFHWKTAMYWKSENLDSSMLQDMTENVLNLF